ncbi:MAG: RloB domain-containing protein, partial [Bacteroidota bacterium]
AEFKRKRAELAARGVTVIVNSPSLERWILLHYEDSKKYYSAQKPIIDRIRKQYLKSYEKSERYFKRKDSSLYQDLRPKLADALNRSKAMPAFDPDLPERAACEMWKLFHILNIKV